MFNFIFTALIGIALITIGIYSIRHPDSWWFRRSRDDIELSDLRIWYLKFAGKMIIAFGALVILMSFQHL
ncbi:hypothetical protein [Paenibacillus glucanolyticus]|uniref:hypothetical protein n=1 Tax=Paenibacillus glucanolyticus TaxID=59843 RepID=UPI00096F5FE2|nr:hypothetical protein [Paenibacillus glucanolyticus]OMF79909.1 hypothetical protein BK142_07625 [Paenibacillus glucanolyticus]